VTQARPHHVFETLTSRQHETLRLASQHLTSKQIALHLGVAPVTVDKRIEAVRAKLDSLPRSDLLRLYRDWLGSYGQTIDDPIILGDDEPSHANSVSLPAEPTVSFYDSVTFDGRVAWDGGLGWLRPGLKPSDLGVTGKLLFMVIAAIGILVVAVLSLAFANALGVILGT